MQKIKDFIIKSFKALPIQQQLFIAKNYLFYDFTEECLDALHLKYQKPNGSNDNYIIESDSEFELTNEDFNDMMNTAYKNIKF